MNRIIIIAFLVLSKYIVSGQIQDSTESNYRLDTVKMMELIIKTAEIYENQFSSHPFHKENYKAINPQKIFRKVFFDLTNIYQFPDSNSTALEVLHLGESVYIPEFNTSSDKQFPKYYALSIFVGGEMYYRDFFLCVTQKGTIGFIYSNNLTYREEEYDSFCSIYQALSGFKSAFVSADLKKVHYFRSNYFHKFYNSNQYLYSKVIKEYLIVEQQKIYIFDSELWTEKEIAFGNEPLLLNDNLVIFYRFEDIQEPKKMSVFLLNLNTNETRKLFSPPDGYTLIINGDDGEYLPNLIYDGKKLGISFSVHEEQEDETFDLPYLYYTIDLRGNILSIENKD